jgi:hypothetical protein
MGVRCCFAGDLSVCPKKPQPTSAHRLFIIRRRPTRSPSQQTMSSRPSRPARCQHKSSGSCSSCEPVRCQHRSSTSCSLCQRERNDLQQVGAWARESRNTTSIDNASFLRDSKLSSHHYSQHSHQLFLTSRTDPEALRTTTTRTKTPAQPHSQSKQSTQPVQSTQHHQQPATTTTQKLYSYKHHPSLNHPLAPPKPNRHPKQQHRSNPPRQPNQSPYSTNLQRPANAASHHKRRRSRSWDSTHFDAADHESAGSAFGWESGCGGGG